jgi:hypothetical protein
VTVDRAAAGAPHRTEHPIQPVEVLHAPSECIGGAKTAALAQRRRNRSQATPARNAAAVTAIPASRPPGPLGIGGAVPVGAADPGGAVGAKVGVGEAAATALAVTAGGGESDALALAMAVGEGASGGAAVGTLVGAFVGSGVAGAVGAGVGTGVGAGVGTGVGAGVGTGVVAARTTIVPVIPGWIAQW